MTREEAVARIKDHIELHRYNERGAVKILEALDMAIKALEQPEIIHCQDCKWSDRSAIGCLTVCKHSRGLVSASPRSYCNFAERRTDES